MTCCTLNHTGKEPKTNSSGLLLFLSTISTLYIFMDILYIYIYIYIYFLTTFFSSLLSFSCHTAPFNVTQEGLSYKEKVVCSKGRGCTPMSSTFSNKDRPASKAICSCTCHDRLRVKKKNRQGSADVCSLQT